MDYLQGKVQKQIQRTENLLLLILISAMTAMVWVQIVSRVSGRSIPWSEEMSRYLLVWLVFFGSAVGVRTKSHIGAEFLAAGLNTKWKRILVLFQRTVFLGFFVLLAYYSIPFILMQRRFGQTAETLQIPMFLITAIIPVSCLLASYHLVLQIIVQILSFKNPSD